jgi:hypothetical protein
LNGAKDKYKEIGTLANFKRLRNLAAYELEKDLSYLMDYFRCTVRQSLFFGICYTLEVNNFY